jgi:hypothetical protein
MENFALQKDKYGKLIAIYSKGTSSHIDGEFEVLEDVTTEDGLRKITLKKKDLAVQRQKLDKLVTSLLKALHEEDSKLAKDILEDHLRDYEEKSIDKMQKMVDEGKPVKKREGCFNIIIGDGRKKYGKGCYNLHIAD